MPSTVTIDDVLFGEEWQVDVVIQRLTHARHNSFYQQLQHTKCKLICTSTVLLKYVMMNPSKTLKENVKSTAANTKKHVRVQYADNVILNPCKLVKQ